MKLGDVVLGAAFGNLCAGQGGGACVRGILVGRIRSFTVCSVRFSGQGLYVYADPSLSGAPTASSGHCCRVQVVLGPMDSIAGIRVCDTGLEGYVDIRYLETL